MMNLQEFDRFWHLHNGSAHAHADEAHDEVIASTTFPFLATTTSAAIFSPKKVVA